MVLIKNKFSRCHCSKPSHPSYLKDFFTEIILHTALKSTLWWKKLPWNSEYLKWNANAPRKQKGVNLKFFNWEYEVIFTFSVFLITGSPFHGGNHKLWQTPPSRWWQNFTLSQILQGKINESFKTISWSLKDF